MLPGSRTCVAFLRGPPATSLSGAGSMLLALLLCTSPLPPIDERAELEAMMQRGRAALARVGYEVPAGVSVERCEPGDAYERMDAEQAVFYPDSVFEGWFALYRAMGLCWDVNAREFRKRSMRGLGQSLVALYCATRQHILLMDSPMGQLNELAGGNLEGTLRHELVHACQDGRKPGLRAWLRSEPGTIDAVTARRILMEGEAEIASYAAQLPDPEALREATADSLESGLTTLLVEESLARIYSAGRTVVLHAVQEGGFERVAAMTQRPWTCEQLLHAEKRDAPAPGAVELPAMAGEILHEDTCGELEIYKVLRLAGVSFRESNLAAMGWDGDRLRVVRVQEPSTGTVVVWRLRWDREDDAEQMAAALEQIGKGSFLRRGRVIDWWSADKAALKDVGRGWLEPLDANAVGSAAEAASTAAMEATFQAENPAPGTSGRWAPANMGFSVPIPAGWKVEERGAAQVLMGPVDPDAPFQTNATYMAPLHQGMTLEQLASANELQFRSMPTLELDRAEVAEHEGREVLWIDYHGTVPGSPHELAFRAIVFLRGSQQVVLTLTARAAQWDTQNQNIEHILQGLRWED